MTNEDCVLEKGLCRFVIDFAAKETSLSAVRKNLAEREAYLTVKRPIATFGLYISLVRQVSRKALASGNIAKSRMRHQISAGRRMMRQSSLI